MSELTSLPLGSCVRSAAARSSPVSGKRDRKSSRAALCLPSHPRDSSAPQQEEQGWDSLLVVSTAEDTEAATRDADSFAVRGSDWRLDGFHSTVEPSEPLGDTCGSDYSTDPPGHLTTISLGLIITLCPS